MPINLRAHEIVDELLGGESLEARAQRLSPRTADPLPPTVPAKDAYADDAVEERRAFLREQGFGIDAISGKLTRPTHEQLKANIESLVGFVEIPLGVMGPLRVNGLHAHGDFYVPLATTEGALVASYQRGARLISLSGGASVICAVESVSRVPGFVFNSLREAGAFVAFVMSQAEALREGVRAASRFAALVELQPFIAGKEVYLSFMYTTGDAAGQNMVTLTTDHLVRQLLEQSPVKPQTWFIEGNMSGDKKATHLSFQSTRGKKVIADVTVPRELVVKYLHCEPEQIFKYWQVAVVGSLQAGSIGMQGHYANALTALFLACGQDVACVSEASVGLTRMDVTEGGDFYVSVSLPNLIVGTVGGGTHLPTARECLAMLDCVGAGKAKKFAEICAATVLAGELSIAGALAAGEFSSAHATFGRKS